MSRRQWISIGLFVLTVAALELGQEVDAISPASGTVTVSNPATAAEPPNFSAIAGLVVDLGNGALYVLDMARSAIFRVPAGGGAAQLFAGTATAGFNDDGKPALATQFYRPAAISLDLRTGELFVADTYNYRVRAITPKGDSVRTVAGVGLVDTLPGQVPVEFPTPERLAVGRYSGDGGPAAAAQLNLPSGVCADPIGILFIADSGNHRVRAVNRGTSPVIVMGVEIGPGEIETIAGTGTVGFSGDGGKATAAQLAFPTQLEVDAAGSLFVVDTFNQRVRKIDRQSGLIRTVAKGALNDISPGVALEHWSISVVSVAVTMPQEILYSDRVDRSVHRLSRGADDSVLFTALQPRDGRVGSIAAGPHGEVYAADLYNNRVLRLDGTARTYVQGASPHRTPVRFPIPPATSAAAGGHG